MLQLENDSFLTARFAAMPDAAGCDAIVYAVKGTFTMGPQIGVAAAQLGVTLADEYEGEPGRSSVRRPADLHLAKPGTDVLLLGHAWAPRGTVVDELTAQLEVGSLRSALRVTGDRRWRVGALRTTATAPEPFTKMPLVFERSFGGAWVDAEAGREEADPRNPVGRGFQGARPRAALDGALLPNLEHPSQSVLRDGDRSVPVGLGPLAPAWRERAQWAGTYDERWLAERAPYLPLDFDPRFFHVAPPELRSAQPLRGGERVRGLALSPQGGFEFRLPIVEVEVEVRVAGETTLERPPLDTLLIEPDEDRFSMVFVGVLPCDKKLLEVERIRVGLSKLEGARA